jgi:hypothetical protein
MKVADADRPVRPAPEESADAVVLQPAAERHAIIRERAEATPDPRAPGTGGAASEGVGGASANCQRPTE